MDFGIFLPIANNGWILSKTSPQFLPSFELNRYVTLRAEAIGFDFVLSMVKWRGYGGETEFWDHALESMTLMAGLAAVTSRIELYASVQPLTLNPAVAARMAVTIDDISGGRFGINIVAGWNKLEYAQMGVWPGDEFYDQRYAYAQEWLAIAKGLWQHGRLTHHGRFLSVEDCLCQPRPSRLPPIVCAGASEAGLRFTVANGDISFVAGPRRTVIELSRRGKALARELGKPLKTYALYTFVLGRTDAEAEEERRAIIAGADDEALRGIGLASANDSRGTTAGLLGSLQLNPFMTPVLCGGPESIVSQITALQHDADLDGILCVFTDFRAGIDFWGAEIMPRLRASA